MLYRVLPSFTEFYRVLPSFTEFFKASLSLSLSIGRINGGGVGVGVDAVDGDEKILEKILNGRPVLTLRTHGAAAAVAC